MYKAILKIKASGKTYETEHESAVEAYEANGAKFAKDRGMSLEDAGDELAFLEQHESIEECLLLDGKEVEIFDHM